MFEETILLGSKDSIDVVVTGDSDLPLNFVSELNVSEMVVFIDGKRISSIDDAAAIKYADGGKVSLVLGGEDLSQGVWMPVAITYYNADYPNDGSPESGKTIIHPQRKHARMRLRAYKSQLDYVAP